MEHALSCCLCSLLSSLMLLARPLPPLVTFVGMSYSFASALSRSACRLDLLDGGEQACSWWIGSSDLLSHNFHLEFFFLFASSLLTVAPPTFLSVVFCPSGPFFLLSLLLKYTLDRPKYFGWNAQRVLLIVCSSAIIALDHRLCLLRLGLLLLWSVDLS